MNSSKKIRALKDRNFRAGLSDSARAVLGEHPAGTVELDAAALEMVSGAFATPHVPGTPGPPGTYQGACCLH